MLINSGTVSERLTPWMSPNLCHSCSFSSTLDSRWFKCVTDRCHAKGKSLSLICGSLTWLREFKRHQFDEHLKGDGLGETLSVFLAFLLSFPPDDGEPEWVVEHARAERRRKALQARHDFERRLAKARDRERKLKERAHNVEPAIKRRVREFPNIFKTSSSENFRNSRVKTHPTSLARTTFCLMVTKVMMAQAKRNDR